MTIQPLICNNCETCRDQDWCSSEEMDREECPVRSCYSCDYMSIYGCRVKEKEKEEPITLTDEQITEMYETGYISTKEKYKDGND